MQKIFPKTYKEFPNLKFSSESRGVSTRPSLFVVHSKILFLTSLFKKNNSIRIFGNPNLKVNKKIKIQKYLKDHRVFMTSVIAALSFGGEWHIHDKDAIKTSFPSFLKIINTFKNE